MPQPVLLLVVVFIHTISYESAKAHTDCLVMVTVSKEQFSTCNDTKWVNATCGSLNNVLSIVSHTVMQDEFACIEVRLMPGRYVITEVHRIRTNVVLRGESGVFVTFDMKEDYLARMNYSSGNPFYTLSFSDAKYSELSSIAFYNSPGLIGFDSITSVKVIKSTFE